MATARVGVWVWVGAGRGGRKSGREREYPPVLPVCVSGSAAGGMDSSDMYGSIWLVLYCVGGDRSFTFRPGCLFGFGGFGCGLRAGSWVRVG